MGGRLALSVSQLNEYVRRMFGSDPLLRDIEVKGEISNLKAHQAGSLFFTVKDEQAAISCVMFATEAAQLQVEPFEGMRVVVTGSVGLYTKTGQYQFYARGLRAQGMGVLYERYQALKEQLQTEGLFLKDKKRPIPGFIDTIGIVSSPTGAVIHDILSVAFRRDPQARILLCPTRVQGAGAADEVIAAIHALETLDQISVIIVARGGGSMEDLWTFNEENVVRAVAACRKPIVSAVGHETDYTLCDLAADLRVPTPSAAAECVVARRDEITARIEMLKRTLDAAAQEALSNAQSRLTAAVSQLKAMSPTRLLQYEGEQVAQAKAQLRRGAFRKYNQSMACLQQRRRELTLLGPYEVLARGYAIVLRDGVPVEHAADLHAHDQVNLRLTDGSVRAKILSQIVQEKQEDAN